jgi:hypothetical protein
VRAILTVEMDGAAFKDDGLEVQRIIRHAASEITHMIPHDCKIPGGCGWQDRLALTLRDINGNRVGELRIVEDAPATGCACGVAYGEDPPMEERCAYCLYGVPRS